MMKQQWLLLLAALCLPTSVQAEEKPSVMIMGTFHFANPGKDVVKTHIIDVRTDKNQQYIERFTSRVSEQYAPTHVLIECPPNKQEKYTDRFNEYKAGAFDLPVNENFQLGFRIALKSNASVVCYDEREISWNAKGLMQWLDKENGKNKSAFDNAIKEITEQHTRLHQNKELPHILLVHNQDDKDTQNKSLYIRLNHVGSGDKFEGADAAASWWHRNFRMYANVQHYAQPGTRVFVLGGQGHTAILKDLLALDPDRTAASVIPLLAE
ncbi:DUF5694 domain-containing protein [Thalassotalea maritima]|uniref:DUF5694 domain-containing protein n=1 Tax=Thalassotalea maritima TaxID=3242416 RepID=UPI003526D211